MLIFGKKGQERETLWWLIDIFMLAIILYTIFYFIGTLGERTTFEKRFIANDMALLIDTLYSVPGDANVYVTYPQETLWFGVKISNERVEVFDAKDPSSLREGANFIGSKNFPIGLTVFNAGAQSKKEDFIKKYIPVLDLIRKKQGVAEQKQLNLTFIKNSKGITIINNKSLSYLQVNSISCDNLKTNLKIIDDIYFIRTDDNYALFNQISSQLENSGKIIYKKDVQESDNKIFVIINIDENSAESYVKSYYNAETGDGVLADISCNLVNTLVFSNLGKGMEKYSSIPYNKISIWKKSGIEVNNLLYVEIGKKEKMENEDYDLIAKQISLILSSLK